VQTIVRARFGIAAVQETYVEHLVSWCKPCGRYYEVDLSPRLAPELDGTLRYSLPRRTNLDRYSVPTHTPSSLNLHIEWNRIAGAYPGRSGYCGDRQVGTRLPGKQMNPASSENVSGDVGQIFDLAVSHENDRAIRRSGSE
jgi:hypothetical protein